MLLKTANTLNYSVLTVGVLLIFIASFSTVQFSCNVLAIIHSMLALKYLLSITVKNLWEKMDIKKTHIASWCGMVSIKENSDEEVWAVVFKVIKCYSKRDIIYLWHVFCTAFHRMIEDAD